MAIDTTPTVGLGEPRNVPPSRGRQGNRPAWLSQHLGTALIGAVGGYALGHFIGNAIASGYPNINGASGMNDVAISLGFGFGFLGWMLGIGALNDVFAKILGFELQPEADHDNWTKYFRYSLNHKTVGKQYVIGVLLFFFTAGLLAMGIRGQLLTPTNRFMGPGTYIAVVGEHGTMMMMMATSLIVGPLGNYFVPLMIGSRRMAFPRIEAFSFWAFAAGYLTILTALPLGGFPTGWTGYAPLQTQSTVGMDSYLAGFAIIGMGMVAAGFNIAVTIITHRAPGMTWSRLPVFCWGMISVASLLTLATPVLISAGLFGLLDRTAQTAFFVNEHGGSSFLWQNLFWFFGHPEVYIMALPGFGIVGELLPVFTRKPLFAYKVSAAGMVGVALLSFFVWQHHLFNSGINPDMRPLFMFTTELISIPTGFIFLVAFGTLWRARIRFEVPMLFVLAVFFNFFIGGVTGVFLSDVPVNTTLHGSFFVMAHFHYTIMGGLVFAFFAGLYYWLPKVTGYSLNKKLGQIHFWFMFIFFNLTFFPLLIVGFAGMPRRVFEYASNLRVLNDISSSSAFVLGASFLIFVANFVWSIFIDPKRASQNPWESKGLEWQVPTPVPDYNFVRIPVVLADPYHYGEQNPPPVADLAGAGAALALAGGSGGGGDTGG
ncbi:MAG: cbb3-type cytochrome c oxidase subunit I [Acidimicrobiales bacterium]